ncbi:Short-chain dehydrogenase/reductase family protein [Mycena venus]|uniref:Short-chain dehydrogenase/reductase family protein n=1 Tax=Mycena venus TaxID=2733690 RepID=A0A8H6XYF8_9AGAR|nr:Short-chain dehydrogenase/reductase family protein [Mycena venus]
MLLSSSVKDFTTLNVTTFNGWDDLASCSVGNAKECADCTIATCPVGWNRIINITVSLAFSPQNAPPLIYVMPGQGDVSDLLAFTDPIPVPPGSQLLALMSWTNRQIISSSLSLLSKPFKPWRNVQYMELYTLINANNLGDTAPLSSTVAIMQGGGTKWVQESAATPLDGISTAGGLWTFVEGAFVLLFGANVFYFAFGRRPLSALGIMHLFQRRSLIKKWHEDFPALHDEGGHPGDTSAGIVAFIRQRLVDLDTVEVQAEKDVMSEDIEAQNGMQNHSVRQEVQLNCALHTPCDLERDVVLNPADCESLTALSRLNKSQEYLIQAGYRLDDIPLTD